MGRGSATHPTAGQGKGMGMGWDKDEDGDIGDEIKMRMGVLGIGMLGMG